MNQTEANSEPARQDDTAASVRHPGFGQVLLPGAQVLNWFAAVVGLAAFVAVQWLKIGMMTVIAAAGMAGLLRYQVIISHF
jgi:predicted phage tail protein